jgi:hypothetical protein
MRAPAGREHGCAEAQARLRAFAREPLRIEDSRRRVNPRCHGAGLGRWLVRRLRRQWAETRGAMASGIGVRIVDKRLTGPSAVGLMKRVD